MPFEREGGPPPEAMNWRAPAEDESPPEEQTQPRHQDQESRPTGGGPEGAAEAAEVSPQPSEAASPDGERPLTPEEKFEQADAKRRAEFDAEFNAELEKVREGIEGEIRTGIAKLYELLRVARTPGSDQIPDEKHFNALVDASGKLSEMPAGMRRVLYKELKRDKKFRTAELPEFTQRCRAVIAHWADMEPLKAAGDNVLDRRDAARRQHRAENPDLPKPESPPPAPPTGQ